MDTSILSFHIHHEICHIISIKVVTFSIPIQVSRRRMHLSNALSGRTGRKSWIFICSELWMKPGKLQNTGWRNITASDLMNPWTTWRRKRTDWWRKARNSQKWVALKPVYLQYPAADVCQTPYHKIPESNLQPDSGSVEFEGRVERITRVHHYGLRDRVSRKGWKRVTRSGGCWGGWWNREHYSWAIAPLVSFQLAVLCGYTIELSY